MLVDPLTGVPAGLLKIVTVYVWPSTPERNHYWTVILNALIPGKYSSMITWLSCSINNYAANSLISVTYMHGYYFINVTVSQTSASLLECFSKTLLTLMNNMKKWCSHRFKHIASCVGMYTYVHMLQFYKYILKRIHCCIQSLLSYSLINLIKYLSCVLLLCLLQLQVLG